MILNRSILMKFEVLSIQQIDIYQSNHFFPCILNILISIENLFRT